MFDFWNREDRQNWQNNYCEGLLSVRELIDIRDYHTKRPIYTS